MHFLGRPALLSPQLRTIPFISLSRARESDGTASDAASVVFIHYTAYSYTTLTRDFIGFRRIKRRTDFSVLFLKALTALMVASQRNQEKAE